MAIDTISNQFVSKVSRRLVDNKRVRRNLPIWGRVHIDRQLPFLCIYRRPTRRPDIGTERLIMGQPAYLTASSHKSLSGGLSELVQQIAKTMSGVFGSFLIIEIWSEENDDRHDETDPALLKPEFDIRVSNQSDLTNTVDTLGNVLSKIKIHQTQATVNILQTNKLTPPRLPTLLPKAMADELGCVVLGLVVRPIYRQADTGEILPLVHQTMIREINSALQRTFFTFVRTQTKYSPPHYQILGRRAMVKAVWNIDKQLAQISNSFDFLLQVTPINAHEAWIKFKRKRFSRQPIFRYRPHVVDPALLKRQLWNVQIERIEDPTLQYLFREKRKELDTQISMLGNINSGKFLHGSMQLYGNLDDQLVATAKDILQTISPHSREQSSGKTLNAQQFSTYARAEIERYRQDFPDFKAEVHVQSNITGLIVSHGNLLVSDKVKISESRVEALINHEIGTHILTYSNGQAQPFQLLSSGLAGYDELQEGLAVLAEYLVGGLSKPRLRLLAARVIVAHSLIEGATFIDSFLLLKNTYRFKQQTAFNITMRIYRAGGLTKDAIYLRGLLQLLQYLTHEPLNELFFIGKFAISHIPMIKELMHREILQPPQLQPHFLNTPLTALRLKHIDHEVPVMKLVDRKDI